MENTQVLEFLKRQISESRLVFIDPSVEDYQSLIAGVLLNTEVIILDANHDGVEQISEVLAQRIGINSLHIVSHGAPGKVYLGNGELGQDNLNSYAGQLMEWAKALSSDAQVLLYGCEVAQSEFGKAFIQRLSELTGATVLASNKRTGSTALGGNWELEVTTGHTIAALAFESATFEAYESVLAKPYLVNVDIPGYDESQLGVGYGTTPSYLTSVNNTLYFFTRISKPEEDPDTLGLLLWKSDGTSTGTVAINDIYPMSFRNAYPYALTEVDGILYILVDGYDYKLWKSDGTPEGTFGIVNLSGTYNSPVRLLENINGIFYFSVSKIGDYGGPIYRSDLWKSDGTQEGTFQLTEFYPNGGLVFIRSSTNINGVLYFSVSKRESYYEEESYYGVRQTSLWKSDSTSNDVVKVKEFPSEYYDVSNLTSVGNIFYFSTAGEEYIFDELWKSDGTEEGTVKVKDIRASNLRNINDTLYFQSYDNIYGVELWKSDGTQAGTVLVKDINLGKSGSLDFDYGAFDIVEVNGIFYFYADDGIHGKELWKSDGTQAGTVLVKDINPGSASSAVPNPYSQIKYPAGINVNDVLYFIADDGIHGVELWKSDGTQAGTVLVKDLNPGAASANPSNLTYLNDTIYFTADDGIHGTGLWAIKTEKIINGDGSRDPLIGTAQSDRILGGTGSKTITGGAGNDEFVYTSIREVGHRITDFTVGSDKIVLTQLLDSLVTGGYNGSDALADGYVKLVQGSTANTTILQIDRDGAIGNAVFRSFLQLDNVALQEMNNINNFVF